MNKYIPADKLIAEIERLLKCTELHRGDAVADGSRQTLYWIKDFITSLQREQPEVDISYEEELKEWMDYGPHTCYPWTSIPDAIKITAEHFYELGNARKEE